MIPAPSEHRVVIGSWLDSQRHALPLRMAVFVQEQGVPAELEHDEFDAQAIHAVVLGKTDTAIATGRLVVSEHGVAKIGRLAVDKSFRGQGLGRLVLMSLVERAKMLGVTSVKLHAQHDAALFYDRLGFKAQGEPFMEAGIRHLLMVKSI